MQQKQKLVNRLMKGSCLDMFGLLNLRIANIAMSQCKIRWISHMMVVNPPQGICESSRHLRIHMTSFMDDEGLHMAPLNSPEVWSWLHTPTMVNR